MSQIVQEGEIRIDFSAAADLMPLDHRASRCEGLRSVDFAVFEERRILLVEIKDPSGRVVPEKGRQEFEHRLNSKTLIAEDLVPKARDSFTYLHLMKRDRKPLILVFVLGAEALGESAAALVGFKDRLKHRIEHEAGLPWRRKYLKDCLALTTEQWKRTFPEYPLKRIGRPTEN